MIMEERLAQKKKQSYMGDANATIFVAKRFSSISFKRETSLESLRQDSDSLFGRPYQSYRDLTASKFQTLVHTAKADKKKLIQEAIKED